MSFILVTDNASNLPVEIIDRYDIKVLPMGFRAGDTEYFSYLKGQDIDLSQFYRMMREGVEFTTSLVTYASCEEVLTPLLKASDEDLLYVGFSNKLSGSFNTVSNYLNDMRELYPQRRFLAVDTLAASLGQGLLVLEAARKREAGASIEEIADWVVENRLHLAQWFTVDDLMFLFHGGRVSHASAIAGTLLDIKPVLHVDDEGRLIPMQKIRSRKKSLRALADKMEELARRPLDTSLVAISHGDCADDAEALAHMLCERFALTRDQIIINIVDPVVGAHCGPGTLALFFMAKER